MVTKHMLLIFKKITSIGPTRKVKHYSPRSNMSTGP